MHENNHNVDARKEERASVLLGLKSLLLWSGGTNDNRATQILDVRPSEIPEHIYSQSAKIMVI